MELGDLPYECLLCIFDCFSNLKLLLNLSTVCKQWNILVKQRLKKIRHLHVESKSDLSYVPFSSDNHIYTDDIGYLERVNVSQLLPNLKFFTKKPYLGSRCTCKMMVNVLSTSKPLVGLICKAQCLVAGRMLGFYCHVNVDEMVKHCGNLEYLDTLFQPFLHSYFLKYKFGQNLKYFEGSIESYNEDPENKDYETLLEETNLLCCYLKQMSNLEVLSLREPLIEPRLWPLPKMKLEEIRFKDITTETPVFQFLPLLPDLRSIDLGIRYVNHDNEAFRDSYTHLNVQDVALDIQFGRSSIRCLKLIRSILIKFPNHKRLFIRLTYQFSITNEDLVQIIKNSPNLTLFVLDVMSWGDANTIETIDKFCKSTGRRISFYLLRDDRTWNYSVRTGSYTRYVLGEDCANPGTTDNKFLQNNGTFWRNEESTKFDIYMLSKISNLILQRLPIIFIRMNPFSAEC
ncbi:uncharacterized protein LOC128387160 isoform X2 [Panonychus citri]|uniref:uncharacterized protein LOC128387160 isoform X2 n=1 Tax=Panonychus citri TaxID=50023 RepID=UPI002307CD83|nr:uncharacterized protein LOC128387160 isoform X2 [Panonychus citri]